jgi:hypothetical protein
MFFKRETALDFFVFPEKALAQNYEKKYNIFMFSTKAAIKPAFPALGVLRNPKGCAKLQAIPLRGSRLPAPLYSL